MDDGSVSDINNYQLTLAKHNFFVNVMLSVHNLEFDFLFKHFIYH